MSSKAAWVMLVCILQTSQVLCQGNASACREPLITGGRYRVEDEQIMASSSYSQDYLPHEARLGGMSWCADNGNTGSWIQVGFGVDVIIQELQIGGDGGFLQYYITQFTIEHGPNSDQLSSILQENSTEPMVFTRPNSPDVSTTVLPTPLTTQVLRIVSVVHSGSEPCVYLEALGCALSPAATDGPPTTDSTTSDTTPTTSTNSPQQTDDATCMTTTMLASAGNTGASTGAIVGGAVGGVIVLLSIIIVVLLVVCMLTKNRSKKTRLTKSEVTYTTTTGVRIVDNEIYGDVEADMEANTEKIVINTAYGSLTGAKIEADMEANTEKMVINTAYGSLTGAKIETDMEESTEKMVINTAYGSLMENAAYSGIKSKPEIIRKELIDNPLYDSTQI